MVTRTILVGKCKVILDNVPPDATEEELYKFAVRAIAQLSLDKAVKETQNSAK